MHNCPSENINSFPAISDYLSFTDNFLKQFGPSRQIFLSFGLDLDQNCLTLIEFLKEFLKI